MQKLAAFAPPSRYVFRDPDTEYEFKANTKKELVDHIISYREQNRLEPIAFLETVLENYWCGLEENIGRCQPMTLKRGWVTTLRGGIALLTNVFMNRMVTPEEAEARAKVCELCPANIFPDKGAFIKWADDLAEESTGGKKTSLNDKLGNCEVCSCCLRAKVWYGGRIKLSDEERKKMVELHCWQPKWEQGEALTKKVA